jgi:REP element-mobilizing transposase RayT
MLEHHFHRRNLPHIYIPERTYFITYRLKDSLPYHKLIELRNRAEFSKIPLNKMAKYEKDKKFFAKYDELLNKGHFGKSHLIKDDVAEIVKSGLHFLNGKDYRLITFCIMPNHVHLIFTLNENSRNIDKIMQSLKRFSARRINIVLNKTGSLWQAESYDHIVRDEDELYRIINYVVNNPVKAGLVENWKDWKHTFIAEEYCLCSSD